MSEVNLNITPTVTTTNVIVNDNTIQITPSAVGLVVSTGGIVGATGATGPEGATGFGATGATGTAGSQGATGLSVLNGATDPTSGVGVNGDFYINTNSTTLFGPKAIGSWPAGIGLVGSTGLTGATGPSGGPTGATGATGPAGSPGGATGATGPMAVVGGANTNIQYNNANSLGGSAAFTFNNSTNVVTATGNIVTSNTFVGNVKGPVINLNYGTENVNLIPAQTGTYNFDLITGGIRYTTSNASANVGLNFRGNSTVTTNTLVGNAQSIVATYVLQNGNTAYNVANVSIDGSGQTIKWVSGFTPIGSSNSISAYTFTIVKTSTTPTYTVLGSMTRYQ